MFREGCNKSPLQTLGSLQKTFEEAMECATRNYSANLTGIPPGAIRKDDCCVDLRIMLSQMIQDEYTFKSEVRLAFLLPYSLLFLVG